MVTLEKIKRQLDTLRMRLLLHEVLQLLIHNENHQFINFTGSSNHNRSTSRIIERPVFFRTQGNYTVTLEKNRRLCDDHSARLPLHKNTPLRKHENHSFFIRSAI